MSLRRLSIRAGRVAAVSLGVLVVFGSASAFAVLAPQYQRQKELTAITESPDVVAALSPHPIDRIEALGPDLYRVVAGRCRLQVRIVGEPQDMPGPRRFHLSIGSKSCR
jgi:hypothetical protein